MTDKRFRYDWKTGRFKDTLSNSCATSNMRVLETQINDACYNYEKKIKELKRENESLNSQLIRLDKELFCQDCLTCRHSKSIDITVKCANGNGITDYQMNCDFYEIDEEWVE